MELVVQATLYIERRSEHGGSLGTLGQKKTYPQPPTKSPTNPFNHTTTCTPWIVGPFETERHPQPPAKSPTNPRENSHFHHHHQFSSPHPSYPACLLFFFFYPHFSTAILPLCSHFLNCSIVFFSCCQHLILLFYSPSLVPPLVLFVIRGKQGRIHGTRCA